MKLTNNAGFCEICFFEIVCEHAHITATRELDTVADALSLVDDRPSLKSEGKISKYLTTKKITFFVAFTAVSYTSYSQSLDYEDLSTMFSRNDRNGRARFVAMGGAF